MNPKYIPSTGSRNLLTEERVKAAYKMYNSANHAAEALGVAPSSFRRACQKYGLNAPRRKEKPDDL